MARKSTWRVQTLGPVIIPLMVISACDDQGQQNQNNNALCGNDIVEETEECDDGPANSDTRSDACRTDCQFPWCGDGVIDNQEECEPLDLAGRSCSALGFTGGVLDCNLECEFDSSECTSCGNGVAEGHNSQVSGYEVCDGTDLRGKDCIALGYTGGQLACTNLCALETNGCSNTPPVCGNSVLETGEECDDGVANSDTDADACRSDCTEPRCGDGVADSSESCDGSQLNSATCQGLGFIGGTLECTPGCAYDTVQCHNCGDGIQNINEQCDGTVLGGENCLTQGFAGGELVLRCTPSGGARCT